MAHLDFFCLVYTDGAAPRASTDPEFKWHELPDVPRPGPHDELFGPFALQAAKEIKLHKKAYLLHGRRAQTRGADQFFATAHITLAHSVQGLKGVGLDVLRCWPFSLRDADELPPDPLAEDVFAVGFEEVGQHDLRAQTYGLAKLGQREIRFNFKDRALVEEAALLCGHLADYVMSQSRRVHHGQSMTFGFDRVMFRSTEGADAGGPLRSWHPPFIQQALPPELFEGIGLLDVSGFQPLSEATTSDLSDILKRSLTQRLLLEELGIPGDAPSQQDTLETCGCHDLATAWKASRVEPRASKESGWTVTCVKAHNPDELHQRSVGELTRKVSALLRYLVLPPGCSVVWNGPAEVQIDCGKLPANQDAGDEDDDA